MSGGIRKRGQQRNQSRVCEEKVCVVGPGGESPRSPREEDTVPHSPAAHGAIRQLAPNPFVGHHEIEGLHSRGVAHLLSPRLGMRIPALWTEETDSGLGVTCSQPRGGDTTHMPHERPWQGPSLWLQSWAGDLQ